MKLIKILFISLIAFFSLTFTVNAAPVVMLDDSFDGTLWDDNWINDGWVQELTYTNTVPFSAKADISNQGFFTSIPMDMSDASSIQVNFAHRHYSGSTNNEFIVQYWDGSQYNTITSLIDSFSTQVWYEYSDTITDPSYFVSDFRIRFSTNIVIDHRAYIDDVFVSKMVGYSITKNVIGAGGIQAPSGPYTFNQVVKLVATPSPGSQFVSWSGDASGISSSFNITMDGNKAVTATFEPIGIKLGASSSYNRGNLLSLTITDGVPNDPVMIQIENPSEVKLIDQRNLNPSGGITYSIIIPSTWEDSTYTIYVKDSLSSSSRTFSIIPYVAPPPSGGGSSGGGGGPSTIPPSSIVIAMLSPKEASKMLDDFSPRQVAKVLMEITDQKHVAGILDIFSTSYAKEVLTNMTSGKPGEILNLMDQTKSIEIISKLKSIDFGIVENMIDDDIVKTATVLETVVKNKINGLPQGERKQALQDLSLMLSNLDRETLLKVFIEITQLPETPITVAYMLESMELSPILDIMNFWLNDEYFTDSQEELEIIFNYFSPELLSDIYVGISNSARLNLLTFLTEAIIQDLPDIGSYSVSDLSISFEEIEIGGSIELTYVINNIGLLTDDYLIPVKINGITEYTDKGILLAGNSITITHLLTPASIGEYMIEVFGSFMEYFVLDIPPIIVPGVPADLVITSLQIVPNQIFSGELVSIFVTIKNLGEVSGEMSVPLKIDTALIDSKDVFLTGGHETVVLFEIPLEYEIGQHIVLVGDQTESFEIIIKPQTGFPWLSTVTILIVISTGIYYAIRENLIDLKEIQKSLGLT